MEHSFWVEWGAHRHTSSATPDSFRLQYGFLPFWMHPKATTSAGWSAAESAPALFTTYVDGEKPRPTLTFHYALLTMDSKFFLAFPFPLQSKDGTIICNRKGSTGQMLFSLFNLPHSSYSPHDTDKSSGVAPRRRTDPQFSFDISKCW